MLAVCYRGNGATSAGIGWVDRVDNSATWAVVGGDGMNDGGPAFPVGFNPGGAYFSGMSLRDWFAGQALAGALASPKLKVPFNVDEISFNCYNMADAMLARHEGRNNVP